MIRQMVTTVQPKPFPVKNCTNTVLTLTVVGNLKLVKLGTRAFKICRYNDITRLKYNAGTNLISIIRVIGTLNFSSFFFFILFINH